MEENDPSRWTLQRCRILGQPKREARPSSEPEKLGTIIPGPQPEGWDKRMKEIHKQQQKQHEELWKNRSPVQYSLPE